MHVCVALGLSAWDKAPQRHTLHFHFHSNRVVMEQRWLYSISCCWSKALSLLFPLKSQVQPFLHVCFLSFLFLSPLSRFHLFHHQQSHTNLLSRYRATKELLCASVTMNTFLKMTFTDNDNWNQRVLLVLLCLSCFIVIRQSSFPMGLINFSDSWKLQQTSFLKFLYERGNKKMEDLF